jgi:hypothetical protein
MRVDLGEDMLDKKAGFHITFNGTSRQLHAGWSVQMDKRLIQGIPSTTESIE